MAIGTLGEHSLHAALKQRYDPTGEYHEVPIGRYIADILLPDGGIIEIQTADFHRLRAKLAAFLPEHIVTVVCPILHTKTLAWLDAETGELLRSKRSPKRWTIYNAFLELYSIKAQLAEPNLRVRIVLLDVTEYRYSTRANRKGYARTDVIPEEVLGEMSLNCVADYAKLVPDELPKRFTREDYQRAAKISRKAAQCAVNTLATLGILDKVGKDGNTIIYTVKNDE